MERLAEVSGSHGFLGTHLSRSLERSGFKVNYLGRDGVITSGGIVFDLAAYGNMAGHTAGPWETYRANTLRVARTLECIRETGAKLIYVSTSSVALPTQTFYSASKRATEEMIGIAVRDWGVKAAIVRPFTVIGSGEQRDHLIPTLINSCIYGLEMPFVERPVHDFVDVDDFVDALLIIAEKGKFQGEIYEVGSGIQRTNRYIRQVVERALNNKANVKVVESLRRYDTKNWKANNRLIYSLGWKPKRTLEETIKVMTADYLPM